jgi:pimeloyl-ACP methyl ester carboxylesterase
MKSYLLVHGAWQDSGCWGKVVSRLQSAGHLVITPDIPWKDIKEQSQQALLSWCIDYLIDILQNHNSMIVAGHSIGGVFISQLAEVIPEKIQTLVYISGFLLKNGQCANDTASFMTDSLTSRNMKLSKNNKNVVVSKHVLREAMYNDTCDEDFLYAKKLYYDQPLWTFQTPVSLTTEYFGRLPKVYIECLKDKSIPIYAQRAMQEYWRCHKVFTLDCSHSPFYSKPDELTDILLNL